MKKQIRTIAPCVVLFFLASGVLTAQTQVKLTAGDRAAGDSFGFAVDIEGDRAVVSAPFDDNTQGNDAGAVYLFEYDGAAWSPQAKLTAPDGTATDAFGLSVSLQGDLPGSAYLCHHNGILWRFLEKSP